MRYITTCAVVGAIRLRWAVSAELESSTTTVSMWHGTVYPIKKI
jgi:hypothetical protein